MGAPPFQFKGRPYKPMTTTCPSEDVKSYSRSKRKALSASRSAPNHLTRGPNVGLPMKGLSARQNENPRRVSSPSEASPVPTLTGVPVRYEKLES